MQSCFFDENVYGIALRGRNKDEKEDVVAAFGFNRSSH